MSTLLKIGSGVGIRTHIDLGICRVVTEAASQSQLGLNKDTGWVEACDKKENPDEDLDGGNHHDGEGNAGNNEELGDAMLDC